jgi:hypothetical protein
MGGRIDCIQHITQYRVGFGRCRQNIRPVLAQERFGISRRFDVRSQQKGEIKLSGESAAEQRLRLVIEGV